MNDNHWSTRADAASASRAASATPLWKWGAGAATFGAACAGAALYNRHRAVQAEANNPPIGRFLTVDGVRLHYLERGEGAPIILLHGNGTMIEDWIAADMVDELARTHRVIAFDRPGFGYSERPRSRVWTPASQAALLAGALRRLGVENAVVAGHSFGSLVALALALDHRPLVAGLALIGGYYYPTARGDVLVTAPPAVPIFGDLMRYTVSPLLGAALAPRINEKLFAPAPVAQEWRDRFPVEMTLRPSQIRAEAAEAAMMIPAAAALAKRHDELTLPVTIVAGSGDRVVDFNAQSRRLHEALPQSRLVEIEGAGHMAHHTASQMVVGAIKDCLASARSSLPPVEEHV